MNKKPTTYNSFIFTHIPKCAGTSFRKYIYNISIQNGIKNKHIYIPGTFDIPNNKNLNQLTGQEIKELKEKNIKVLANHSKFNEHSAYGLELKNPFYYTILRDPVSRFISHYNFFYYKHGSENFRNKSLNELSKTELLDILRMQSNVQTMYLANVKFFRSFELANVLKVAKYNLQYEFSCFGILERIEDSIILLNDNLPSWLSQHETDFPLVNSNKKTELKVEPNILRLIKEHNKFDIDLYKFANHIFENILLQEPTTTNLDDLRNANKPVVGEKMSCDNSAI